MVVAAGLARLQLQDEIGRREVRACRLSTEKATDRTSLPCPMKRRVVLPVFRSHSRRVASHDPDRANCPSEEMTTSCRRHSDRWVQHSTVHIRHSSPHQAHLFANSPVNMPGQVSRTVVDHNTLTKLESRMKIVPDCEQSNISRTQSAALPPGRLRGSGWQVQKAETERL